MGDILAIWQNIFLKYNFFCRLNLLFACWFLIRLWCRYTHGCNEGIYRGLFSRNLLIYFWSLVILNYSYFFLFWLSSCQTHFFLCFTHTFASWWSSFVYLCVIYTDHFVLYWVLFLDMACYPTLSTLVTPFALGRFLRTGTGLQLLSDTLD